MQSCRIPILHMFSCVSLPSSGKSVPAWWCAGCPDDIKHHHTDVCEWTSLSLSDNDGLESDAIFITTNSQVSFFVYHFTYVSYHLQSPLGAMERASSIFCCSWSTNLSHVHFSDGQFPVTVQFVMNLQLLNIFYFLWLPFYLIACDSVWYDFGWQFDRILWSLLKAKCTHSDYLIHTGYMKHEITW